MSSPFLDESNPPKSALKLSPTWNWLAPTVSVPTPLPITLPSTVVALTVTLFAV